MTSEYVECERPVIPPYFRRINIISSDGVVFVRNVSFRPCSPLGSVRLWDEATDSSRPGEPVELQTYGKRFRTYSSKNKPLCWAGWTWEYC